ncbi:MAG: META domain-containing protein [Treponema sp.]|nr:META domain-containing protein [Treponema sp.]
MKHKVFFMGLVLAILALAASCAHIEGGGLPEFSGVENREWILVELIPTAEGEEPRLFNWGDGVLRYTLAFSEGLLSGTAAPNRYFGNYDTDEAQGISISPLGSTMMASLYPPEGFLEHEFFRYLEAVHHWDLREGRLELYSFPEELPEGVLIFRPLSR